MESFLLILGGCASLLLLPLLYLFFEILGFIVGAFAGWMFMAVVPFFGA